MSGSHRTPDLPGLDLAVDGTRRCGVERVWATDPAAAVLGMDRALRPADGQALHDLLHHALLPLARLAFGSKRCVREVEVPVGPEDPLVHERPRVARRCRVHEVNTDVSGELRIRKVSSKARTEHVGMNVCV